MNIGEFELNNVYCIDSLKGLKKIDNDSIQCVVTSPPYWGLRDYNHPDQLGLEETPEKYVENLVKIFSEVKRVLKKNGTIWLNLGDTYYSKGSPFKNKGYPDSKYLKGRTGEFAQPQTKPHKFLKPKDMVGIPWRVAFALQKELSLYLRQAIIWHKPNAMPSSTKDRPVTDYEFIFLFSKSEKYYYNYEAVREKYTKPLKRWGGNNLLSINGNSDRDKETGQNLYRDRNMRPNSNGRNCRAVWNFKDNKNLYISIDNVENDYNSESEIIGTISNKCPVHSFVLQPEIKDKIFIIKEEQGDILFTISYNNAKILQSYGCTCSYYTETYFPTSDIWSINTKSSKEFHFATFPEELPEKCIKAGTSEGDIVLDPFIGIGTTAMVAKKLKRNYIGFDINSEYIELSKQRIEKIITYENIEEFF